ncbi:MAG: glutathione S-transferase C-terminal domain-containing protein [Prochlorococcaceae cyanobacterium]|jgi:putative glutathione S-transferase
MRPPAPVIQAVRQVWHWQWRQLMTGLGPADAEGRYRRPSPAFGERPPVPADAATALGHVLIVGRSCPWAHRAWLVWSLRQLQGSIELVVVEPDPRAALWRFPEPFEGCRTLAELYRRSGAPPGSPTTVPCLYSRSAGRLLVNESAVLIELLNLWPSPTALDLSPPEQAEAIGRWRERLQSQVNDGVYRCGFARTQAAYDEAEAEFWSTLEAVEQALEAAAPASGWLCGGPQPSLADLVLFPTLIRLELVYAPLFGCGRRPLWSLPALWRWRQRLWAWPGVAATCWPERWRADYFGNLFPLHPSGIVPAGPELATLVQGTPPPGPAHPDVQP